MSESFVKQISGPYGNVGTLHGVEVKDDDVLIFQMPRRSNMISPAYEEEVETALNGILPNGQKCIMLPADVDVYKLCGEDAVMLIMKGIIK